MRLAILISIVFLFSCGTYKRNDTQNYNETVTTKIDKSVSTDSDKDGIRNKFDKCPNTPKGVSVDSHGCPRDTDGDGVADYKDKELITPSSCQPADSNGVGDCNRK